MLRLFLGVFLWLLLASCSPHEQNGAIPEKVAVPHPTKKAFSETDPSWPEKLAMIKHIDQAFPLERVIRLQATGDHVFGGVSGLVRLGDILYVLDHTQKRIFICDRDGLMMGQLSQKGQGPGEYEMPYYIYRAWGDKLLVVEQMGAMHLYNKDGTHHHTIPASQEWFSPRGHADWSDPKRLITTWSMSLPNHYLAIVDTENLKKPSLLKKVMPKTIKATDGIPLRGFTAFARVGRSIWAASPYEGEIHIFHEDGERIKVVSLGDSSPLTTDEYKRIAQFPPSSPKYLAEFEKFESVIRIQQVGPTVLVFSTKHLYLYDHEGNRLTRNLPITFGGFSAGDGVRFISQYFIPEEPEIRKIMAKGQPGLWAALEAAGLNEESDLNDIFLRVGILTGHKAEAW